MRPPGPWMRAELYFTGEEKEWSNIYWFKPFGGAINFATFDFDGWASTIQAAILAATKDALSSTCKCRGTYLTANDGTATVGYDYYNEVLGTDATALVPEDVAAVVQTLSATPGRSGRGRLYIAGLCTASVAGSYLSVTGQANLGNLTLLMKSTLPGPGGDSANFCVVSPKLGTILEIKHCNLVLLLGTNRKRKTRF